jgi:hypothetical protein
VARGISLHIGLNEVSASHYRDAAGEPWTGKLFGCENDARDMAKLAKAQGFEVRGPVLGADATSTAVLGHLGDLAKELTAGDICLLTYSGHGGQVKNENPDDDPEEDDLDETWCLYDRQLLDDELFAAFSDFGAGVRIVVLSDSCHSGTVSRANPPDPGTDDARIKQLPFDVALATEKANAAFYSLVQKEVPTKRLTSVAATVVLVSGCQDHQFSRDGRVNGAFTSSLLKAWRDPEARRSLPRLLKATSAGIPPAYGQEPNYSIYSFDIGPALSV